MSIQEGTVVHGKWRVGKKIGEGGCGQVYLVKPDGGNNEVNYDLVLKAIKLPRGTSKKDKEQKRLADTLYYEYSLCVGHLNNFEWKPRFPTKFYGEDAELGIRYIVMEKLDEDLASYAKGKHLTPSEIAAAGLDMIAALEALHKKGFLFIDIKPQNFMRKRGRVLCIDFGLLERWMNAYGHRPQEPRVLTGTPAFCSIDVHNNLTPSRKDEIESMGYVLLSMAMGGSLPWSNATSDADVKRAITTADVKGLAADCSCDEIGDIILYARSLGYTAEPDYTHIKSMLNRLKTRPQAAAKPAKSATPVKPSAPTPLIPAAKVSKAAPSPSTAPTPIAASQAATRGLSTPIATSLSMNTHKAAVKVLDTIEATPISSTVKTALSINKAKLTLSRNKASTSTSIADKTDKENTSNEPNKKLQTPLISTTDTVRKRNLIEDNTTPVDTKRPRAYSVDSDSGCLSPIAELEESFLEASNGVKYVVDVLSGPSKGSKFIFDGSLAIGRTYDNQINDDCISERHLKIQVVGDELKLQDVGSTNGTSLNNEPVRKRRWVPLTSGDTITIGSSILVCKKLE